MTSLQVWFCVSCPLASLGGSVGSDPDPDRGSVALHVGQPMKCSLTLYFCLFFF